MGKIKLYHEKDSTKYVVLRAYKSGEMNANNTILTKKAEIEMFNSKYFLELKKNSMIVLCKPYEKNLNSVADFIEVEFNQILGYVYSINDDRIRVKIKDQYIDEFDKLISDGYTAGIRYIGKINENTREVYDCKFICFDMVKRDTTKK